MDYNWPALIALVIFVISYAVIISEKIHKTVVSLAGASLLILFGVISQEEAVDYIDFNTIGLLLGMMILVSIIKQTGIFEFIAIRQAKMSKGRPIRIMASFALLTGILSAFLDNVTTIIVVIPVTLNICKVLGISPIPFVVSQIFASNIGGTATLVGDPPNIMIGSAADFTFADFIYNLAPIAAIVLVITTGLFLLIYREKLKLDNPIASLGLDEKNAIKNKGLLYKSLLVMGLVILGLFLHGVLHLESATIAIAGAVVLLTISKIDVSKVMEGVEWKTIFFFVGLFILVGGLEKTGILRYLAGLTFEATGGNLFFTGLAMLWVSAVLSAFIDNIPFVATVIPMIITFAELSGGANVDFLWWCLSLGACFGGNGTIIGASANVVGTDILKSNGYDISFFDYLKIAFPLMLLSVIAASIYAAFILF